MKIYPMAFVRESGAYKLYNERKYKPYTKEELISLLKNAKQSIPRFCRVERVIRDIPAESIVEGGAKVSNLRQIVGLEMQKEGLRCNCIRCREVKSSFNINDEWKMFRMDYEASAGHEVFLSVESKDRSKLYSMLRLRINTSPTPSYSKRGKLKVLNNASIVREIHTYGPQVKIGDRNEIAAQHKGFGKMLIDEAERITREEFGVKKIAVIAGVGVRGYFRKLGYNLMDSYMVKEFKIYERVED
jgi:elongator complex protein 3